MIPTYTYRKETHDWELTQDGYCLGYIKRTGHGLQSHWLASPDGIVWKSPFNDRKSAREYLQNV